jgi:hypothetical protein
MWILPYICCLCIGNPSLSLIILYTSIVHFKACILRMVTWTWGQIIVAGSNSKLNSRPIMKMLCEMGCVASFKAACVKAGDEDLTP